MKMEQLLKAALLKITLLPPALSKSKREPLINI